MIQYYVTPVPRPAGSLQNIQHPMSFLPLVQFLRILVIDLSSRVSCSVIPHYKPSCRGGDFSGSVQTTLPSIFGNYGKQISVRPVSKAKAFFANTRQKIHTLSLDMGRGKYMQKLKIRVVLKVYVERHPCGIRYEHPPPRSP